MVDNIHLSIPILLSVVIAWLLLRRAYQRTQLLPEELALAFAWAFVVGGLMWLEAFSSESTLLGFGEPWTWLAAVHFAAAGYGVLTISALTCRVVSDARALRRLRVLLAMHPVVYFVTAAGLSGVAYCSTLGAFLYEALFIVQFVSYLRGMPNRMAKGPRIALIVALSVPVVTLLPALVWAWDSRRIHLSEIAYYHGVINAAGHVGLGFVAFLWGRPPAHAPISRDGATPGASVA
jgi:hypothetical protein